MVTQKRKQNWLVLGAGYTQFMIRLSSWLNRISVRQPLKRLIISGIGDFSKTLEIWMEILNFFCQSIGIFWPLWSFWRLLSLLQFVDENKRSQFRAKFLFYKMFSDFKNHFKVSLFTYSNIQILNIFEIETIFTK